MEHTEDRALFYWHLWSFGYLARGEQFFQSQRCQVSIKQLAERTWDSKCMWQNGAQISCPGKCLLTRVSCHSAFQQWGTLWGMGASRACSCSAWALAKALAGHVLINSDKLWAMLGWWQRSFWDILNLHFATTQTESLGCGGLPARLWLLSCWGETSKMAIDTKHRMIFHIFEITWDFPFCDFLIFCSLLFIPAYL